MKLPAWVITNVKPQKDFKLELLFADGSSKFYDAKPLLKIHPRLQNPAYFNRVYVDECGGLAWDEDIDVAPEFLYKESVPIMPSVS